MLCGQTGVLRYGRDTGIPRQGDHRQYQERTTPFHVPIGTWINCRPGWSVPEQLTAERTIQPWMHDHFRNIPQFEFKYIECASYHSKCKHINNINCWNEVVVNRRGWDDVELCIYIYLPVKISRLSNNCFVVWSEWRSLFQVKVLRSVAMLCVCVCLHASVCVCEKMSVWNEFISSTFCVCVLHAWVCVLTEHIPLFIFMSFVHMYTSS